jgi:hypothetical protein
MAYTDLYVKLVGAILPSQDEIEKFVTCDDEVISDLADFITSQISVWDQFKGEII